MAHFKNVPCGAEPRVHASSLRKQKRMGPCGVRQHNRCLQLRCVATHVLLAFATRVASTSVNATATDSIVVLFPEGSWWRYWDRGPLPPSDIASGRWRQASFDDTLWDHGPGLLAFGDATAATQLAARYQNDASGDSSQQRTVYFRRSVALGSDVVAALVQGSAQLWARMLVDDGLVM
jgi:hypothetical protein